MYNSEIKSDDIKLNNNQFQNFNGNDFSKFYSTNINSNINNLNSINSNINNLNSINSNINSINSINQNLNYNDQFIEIGIKLESKNLYKNQNMYITNSFNKDINSFNNLSNNCNIVNTCNDISNSCNNITNNCNNITNNCNNITNEFNNLTNNCNIVNSCNDISNNCNIVNSCNEDIIINSCNDDIIINTCNDDIIINTCNDIFGKYDYDFITPMTKCFENDTSLPIANIGRLMKSVLPNTAKIAKQAKDMIRDCVTEFIFFISSEASDLCNIERRKTLNADDIMLAMNKLGFEHYNKPLRNYHNKWKEIKDLNIPQNHTKS